MDSSRWQTGCERSKHRRDGKKAGIAEAVHHWGARRLSYPAPPSSFTDQPVNTNTQSKPGFKILGLGIVAKRRKHTETNYP